MPWPAADAQHCNANTMFYLPFREAPSSDETKVTAAIKLSQQCLLLLDVGFEQGPNRPGVQFSGTRVIDRLCFTSGLGVKALDERIDQCECCRFRVIAAHRIF